MTKEPETRDVVAYQILNADAKVNREMLLEEIFKNTIVDFFKFALQNQAKTKWLAYNLMLTCKGEVINEFRSAELGPFQKSTEWYEKIFNKTLYDLLEYAGDNHPGTESKEVARSDNYAGTSFSRSSSGLYVPKL